MKTKKHSKVFLFLCTIIVTSSCTFAKHKPGKGVGEATSTVCSDSIDFQVVTSTVLQPKCLACHGSGSGLVALDTYSSVTANIGKIQAAVQSGRMPPGKPLSAAEQTVLATWITNGTPQAANSGAAACNDGTGGEPVIVPTLAPHYESIRAMILEPRCLSCHGEGNTLDFSSYAKILENKNLFQSKPGEDGIFVAAVASGMMPPKKNPDLSLDEVTVIRQWVMMGIPERADTPGIDLNAPTPVDPPPVVPTNPIDPLPTEIACLDFATISGTVLQPKCVGCHGGAGGVDLDSYANVQKHLGAIETMVASGKMPPKKPLDAALKEQLLGWIKNGAPEKSKCETPPVVAPIEPLEATYNSMKTHFLDAKCIICHDGSRKKGDDDSNKPDFSTYLAMVANKDLFDFKEPHKSDIVDEVLDGDMPPAWSSAKKLTPIEIDILIEWIKNGLPEG